METNHQQLAIANFAFVAKASSRSRSAAPAPLHALIPTPNSSASSLLPLPPHLVPEPSSNFLFSGKGHLRTLARGQFRNHPLPLSHITICNCHCLPGTPLGALLNFIRHKQPEHQKATVDCIHHHTGHLRNFHGLFSIYPCGTVRCFCPSIFIQLAHNYTNISFLFQERNSELSPLALPHHLLHNFLKVWQRDAIKTNCEL